MRGCIEWAGMKPKLTLRDLFWLVLVVAMGCAWWLDRSWLEIERKVDREFYISEINELKNQLKN